MLGYHRDYRPETWDGVIGQDNVVAQLKTGCDTGATPHAMLFTGPSGVGKTTAARILRNQLGCHASDYVEINAASSRGIDTIRDINQNCRMRPMERSRVYVLDECHQLTTPAQQSMLKMLEDCPDHVYFVLVTSEPGKLINAVKTRCTPFAFSAVPPRMIVDLLRGVLREVNPPVKAGLKELCHEISDACDGSPRMALVMLEAALKLDDPDARVASVRNAGTEQEAAAIDLARALVSSDWSKIRTELKRLDATLKSDHESVRRVVLGYCATVLLNKGDEQAFRVANLFETNFLDSGRAGIILASYAASH